MSVMLGDRRDKGKKLHIIPIHAWRLFVFLIGRRQTSPVFCRCNQLIVITSSSANGQNTPPSGLFRHGEHSVSDSKTTRIARQKGNFYPVKAPVLSMKWAKMAVESLIDDVSFSVSSGCERCFSTVGKEGIASVAHLLHYAHLSASFIGAGQPKHTKVNVFYDEINRYVCE